MPSKASLSYGERARHHRHPVARRLFEIAEQKKTNLVVAADMGSTDSLLYLADVLGPHIAIFKTRSDLVEDFGDDTVAGLQQLKAKHNFLIFEDCQHIDIGGAGCPQYHGGARRISEWADVVNASVLAGPDVVQAISEVISSPAFARAVPEPRAVLVVAEMSSHTSLAGPCHTQAAIKIARDNPGSVIGVVVEGREAGAQAAEAGDGDLVVLTTDVDSEMHPDRKGEVSKTPREVVLFGCDFIVVGRGIHEHSAGQIKTAQRFQELGWAAYLERLARDAPPPQSHR